MNKTKIEWVRNPDDTPGYTWNPITGCLNHVDGFCKGGGFKCYAYRLATTRLEHVYMADKNTDRFITVEPHSPLNMPDPFYPRFWPEKLEEFNILGTPYTHPKRKGIFVCDMSDLFGIGIPGEWTWDVINHIKAWLMHRFYLLTKQPQNLAKFSPFPENCWVGVTATGYKDFVDALVYLMSIKASVKYISFEPLLSWDRVITNNYAYSQQLGHAFKDEQLLRDAGIKWVIIGAQSRPTVYPKIEWVDEIVEAADKAGIPVFLKDNLSPLIAEAREAKGMWAAPHLLRQELPDVS